MANNISIRDIQFIDTPNCVKIIVTTDVPCQLYARYTPYPPWVHRQMMIDRGLAMMDDIRFCFVSFTDILEISGTGTTTHTFLICPWAPCTTLWFYLWGFVAGLISPSVGPILHHHNIYVPPPPVTEVMAVPTIKRDLPSDAKRTPVAARLSKVEVT